MRRRESLKRGAKLLLMNAWTVPTNAASQGQRRGLWLWLHIKEQHCLNNTSQRAAFFLCSCPPQAMPTEVFMGLPDVPDHRSDQDGKKIISRYLFSPPRSAPWKLLPHSCVNSWLWQSTGREVGWASVSKGEPGLYKLSLPSEKCSKNHSPSCMNWSRLPAAFSVYGQPVQNWEAPAYKSETSSDLFLLLGAVLSAVDHAGCSTLCSWIPSRSSFVPLKKRLPEVNWSDLWNGQGVESHTHPSYMPLGPGLYNTRSLAT